MTYEVELKLRIQPADVLRLRRHPAVEQASVDKPLTRKLTSIYFDTPQLALLDAGLSLRVRHMDGGWFQAVKGAGTSLAGLHRRKEWEDIIASAEPDFSKIVAPELTKIFDDPVLRSALNPIFTTDVRRTEWHLTLEDGTLVEMALDQGELIAGDTREPICEIELELKHGRPASLFKLALALQANIPLWIENVSKAERGYVHYRPQTSGSIKATAAALNPSMHIMKAWDCILQTCIGQLQGNHDLILQVSDPEGVHQMRVALRRLRSALAMYQGWLPGEDELLAELRWLADVLGRVRDLDVFLLETLPPVLSQFAQHAGLQQLRQKAQQTQHTAMQELCTALQSQRYQRLLLDLGGRIECRTTPSPDSLPTLMEFAHATLQKRYKALKQHGRELHTLAPDERHAARIAAKKLRYTAEFFASLYPEQASRPFLRQLAKLQDILGTLNDINVTRSVFEQLVGAHPSYALAEAISVIDGWNACQGAHQLQLLQGAWDKVAETKPFWN